MTAAAAAMGHARSTAGSLAKIVRDVMHSPFWDQRAELLSTSVRPSKAYMLVWQNDKDGDVDGRKSSHERILGALGLCILELAALGKVTVSNDKDPRITYPDQTPTGDYLDDACFKRMIDRHNKKAKFQGEKLEKVMFELCWGEFMEHPVVATRILTSLCEDGILAQESGFSGKTFKTVNPEPEKAVTVELEQTVASGQPPSFATRCLIVMIRGAERHCWRNLITKANVQDGDKAKKVFDQIYKQLAQ
eukprot:TRINITY_DN95150_c0_g1_i1.p1 TRINITY_DN95150_c0_g1~~TRINITY_DN95150_c0_g1_i1.p1  ORF type:complete len:256 (-),score=11.35 TRINITY_DN95150_c0_g1_i1:105-848(-)